MKNNRKIGVDRIHPHGGSAVERDFITLEQLREEILSLVGQDFIMTIPIRGEEDDEG